MNVTNIIRGVVNATKYTVTAPIIKEDYGLYLKIEGLDLPAVYEVDFSNSENSGSSVTMVGNADGVLIPRQFIKSGQDVFAFLYWDGEDFGRTVYKFRIPNKLRPDRTEEQPTPEEQSLIDQAINALNTAVEQTAADVETTTAKAAEATSAAATATQKASEATESAQSAGTYATRAETALHGAETARTASQQSATASATSAEQAAGSALTASTKAGDASASATAAAQSASSAGQSALDARDYKDAANLSAESASEYAGSASDSATTATEQATIATNKASESAQSALDASTAKDDAVTAKTAAETAQSGAEVARTGAENAETNANATVHGILENLDLTETSGAIVETEDAFPAGAERMTVKIDPVQDLSHGDPSPDNICPIEGWTGMNVQRTGTNIWDEDWEVGTIIGGADSASSVTLRSKNYIPVVSGGTYFFSAPNNKAKYIYCYDQNKAYIGTTLSVAAPSTFEVPSECYYVRFAYTYYIQDYATYNHDISINYSATDHDYHPYTGQTFPISFGEAGTVYSGTLDVVTGELVVDRAEVDLGTLTWGKTGSRAFYAAVPYMVKKISPNLICSLYPYDGGAGISTSTKDKVICYDWNTLGRVIIFDTSQDYTDAATFKSAMSGVQLVYELEEPQTYHLSPTQISLLKDYNLLWADTGDITDFAYRIGELASKATTDNHEQRISAIEEILPTKAPIIEDTATGAVASFPDGADDFPMKSLKVAIDPVQDLHGYENPWPAGGGKNQSMPIGSTTFAGITTATNADGITTVSGTATGNGGRKNLCSESFTLKAGTYVLSHNSTGAWGTSLNISEPDSSGTAIVSLQSTNASIAFTLEQDTSVVVGINVLSGNTYSGTVKPQIESGSTATAWVPYSNICPISGWTGAQVQRTGVNIWDEEWERTNINWNTRKFTPNQNGGRLSSKNYIPVLEGATYYFHNPYGNVFMAGYADEDSDGVEVAVSVSDRQFTVPNGVHFVKFGILTSAAGTEYNHDISINYPSTDHDYHAYAGNSYSVSWETEAGTVYGGTLDVVSGELVVDRAEVDLGTFEWTYNSNLTVMVSKLPSAKVSNNAKGCPCVCDSYLSAADITFSGWANFPDKAVSCGNNYSTGSGTNLVVKDTAYTDAATFKTAMDGVQLVYELATPQTYHLTPTEVRTLLGQNNVWADTGDSTVEYYCDTKRYIDKKIAELG